MTIYDPEIKTTLQLSQKILARLCHGGRLMQELRLENLPLFASLNSNLIVLTCRAMCRARPRPRPRHSCISFSSESSSAGSAVFFAGEPRTCVVFGLRVLLNGSARHWATIVPVTLPVHEESCLIP